MADGTTICLDKAANAVGVDEPGGSHDRHTTLRPLEHHHWLSHGYWSPTSPGPGEAAEGTITTPAVLWH